MEQSASGHLAEILKTSRVKHFPKNQIILYEGDVPESVYIIKTGVVKMYDLDDQGNEKILHIMKSPALIPFMFFTIEAVPLKWYYTALTDCDMYVLSREDLLDKVRENGLLAAQLMSWFSREVHELLVRLSSLGKTNARDKITAALRFFAVEHCVTRRSGWMRVNFPVNHQLIADMTGITRESATAALKDLRENKIIRNPRVTILELNPKKLLEEDD